MAERNWLTDKVTMGLMPGGWFWVEKLGVGNWGWQAMNGFMRIGSGHSFTRRGAVRAAKKTVEERGRGTLPAGV